MKTGYHALTACCWLLAASGQAFGDTYYVAPAGSDTSPGTELLPLRTVQRAVDLAVAGDLVLVAPGEYKEYVRTRANGTPAARITFQAQPANDPQNQVILKQIRVQHEFNTFEGFNLTGAQNAIGAYVRIDRGGNHTVITNCTLRDGVFYVGECEINDQDDSLHAPGAAWAERGFEVGGQIYMGGASLLEYAYANHDTRRTVSAINGDRLYVNEPFVNETNSPAWMPVFAGMNRNGITGVNFVPSGGVSATNCVVDSCVFSNIWGHAFTLLGYNHTIARNKIEDLHSYAGIRVNGGGHKIHHNMWLNCTNFIHYSSADSHDVQHPAGSGWYDYVVGFVHSTTAQTPTGTNVQFYSNWIQNSHNPIGQVSEAVSGPDHYYGFYMRSNVFVGMASSLNGGRNGLTVEDNTFYRVAFGENRSHAVTIGGNLPETPATNMYIRGNVFVDIGSHRSLDNEGFYGLVNSVDSEADSNLVAGPETTGWAGKDSFNELTGINGGDPLLVNPEDPLGPDGLPFTADDGLKPLPGSPMALGSLGALEPVPLVVGQPLAHFSVIDLSTGLAWHDVTGTAFNPGWEDLAPFERTDKSRPWHTPEALGDAPVTVTFSAEKSISALTASHLDWQGITSFSWSFGDGASTTTTQPEVEHTYHSGGRFRVTLTVENASGNVDSAGKTYRVLGEVTGTSYPLAPTGLHVVPKT